jgi:hypothetical protein
MASKASPSAHLSSGGPANLSYLYDVTKKEVLNLLGEVGAAELVSLARTKALHTGVTMLAVVHVFRLSYWTRGFLLCWTSSA